jgi:N-formylglutamate amidohydrolase
MVNDLNLFGDTIKDSILLHIPHSSKHIPNKDSFLLDEVQLNKELLLSTDIATNQIFQVDNIKKFTCDFNRLFCDVERFIIGETMDSYGRGLYYTHTIDNKKLRKFDYSDYWDVLTNYFIPYHSNLTDVVQSILNKNGQAIIIDCHSFNDNRLWYENDSNRPDICIGIDNFHTPNFLTFYLINHFKKYGLTVETNNPYSGSLVPTKFYQKDVNVQSIMIEINKRLYMTNDTKLNNDKVQWLNGIIKELLNF